MKIEGKEYRTIWFENNIVKIIDQTKLPHQFIIKDLKTIKDSLCSREFLLTNLILLRRFTSTMGLVNVR